MTRPLESLAPEEIMAVAIDVERSNAQRFRAFAGVFESFDEAVAARFEELAQEEDEHEAILVARFKERFGDTIPVVEEVEVEGVIESVDLDDSEHMIFSSLEPEKVYRLAHRAEVGAQKFYLDSIERTDDPELKSLFKELADMEDDHAGWLEEKMREAEVEGGRGE